MMKAGKVKIDFEKRKRIYWNMQELIRNESGNAIFAFPTDLDAYDQNINAWLQMV